GRTWSEVIAEPAATHPDTGQDPVGVPPSGGIRIPADRLNAAHQPRTPAESDPAQPISPNDHPGRFRPVEPALLLAPQHGAQPHAPGRFGFEQPLVEPARPTPRPPGLATDSVNLATPLGTHGRLLGERSSGRRGSPIPSL